MTFFMDVFVSIGCIIVTISISQFFRELARDKWEKDRLGRLIFLEFVAAFEMTAVAYETSIIFEIAGISVYAIFIFSVWAWRTKNWHEVSASPCSFVEDWVMRRISLPAFALAIIAQVAGGFMSYKYYTALYWSIGFSDAHNAKVHEGFTECKSSINGLPMIAMLSEATGLFVYIVTANLISRVKYLEGVAGILNAFIGTSLVILAFDTSGGYYNPVLASSMQYGCSGSTVVEHLQVYWVGDTIGTFAAYYFDRFVTAAFSKAKGTVLESTQQLPQKRD